MSKPTPQVQDMEEESSSSDDSDSDSDSEGERRKGSSAMQPPPMPPQLDKVVVKKYDPKQGTHLRFVQDLGLIALGLKRSCLNLGRRFIR